MIPSSQFYQLGFVARDLDHATAALAARYGVARFRRKRSSDWMETAHAWTGGAMIELMVLSEGAPPLYAGHLPEDASAIRLHHHGYRVRDEAGWAEIERRVAEANLDVPMKGAVMGGDLRFMYVDTRADLGIFSEFVMLSGAAATLYDDVPCN